MQFALALLGLLFAAGVQAGQCAARSGDRMAVLVELYTSEECSSCPPAERWLSSLGERYSPERVVPLSLHVDYWDYIGWKDPYAKRELSARQRKLTRLQKNALVYTPQVMLQGQGFRRWRAPDFDAEVTRINSRPARAQIALKIHSASEQALDAEATVQVRDASLGHPASLYMAVYENKLPHDYVVLEWQRPFGVAAGAPQTHRRSFPLLPKAVPAHSGVAAFVQSRRTGEVLQALMLPACPA